MHRHRADLVSLFFGLVFAAVGLVLLTGGARALSLAWVGPLVALALGVVLLYAARSSQAPSAGVEPPPDD